MATRKSQRIAIWVIALVMLAGTVGGFVAMMVQPGNDARDQAALKKAQEEYTKAQQEHQKKVEAQANELSAKYFGTFKEYSARVGEFNKDEVKELATEDLVVGEGTEIKDDTKFAAYYIGWNPSGKVFDQSINGEKLKAPFAIDGPKNASVIEGWKKGLVGMKIGGIRELTIPSAQAYGESGQGEDIPANTPLKFVIMAIDKPADIAKPEMPQVLKNHYRKTYGIDPEQLQ